MNAEEVSRILTLIGAHYWQRGKTDDFEFGLQVEMWTKVFEDMPGPYVEQALVQWFKDEPWMPQASELRAGAIALIREDQRLMDAARQQQQREALARQLEAGLAEMRQEVSPLTRQDQARLAEERQARLQRNARERYRANLLAGKVLPPNPDAEPAAEPVAEPVAPVGPPFPFRTPERDALSAWLNARPTDEGTTKEMLDAWMLTMPTIEGPSPNGVVFTPEEIDAELAKESDLSESS